VGASHHDDVVAPFGHELGFEIAAVHCLEVGDDWTLGKRLRMRGLHSCLGDDERGAGFEPVNAGTQRHLGGGNASSIVTTSSEI